MDEAQRPTHVRRRQPFGRDGVPLDEARDEAAVCERHHFRPDAERSRRERCRVLVLTVDPEECGVLATDPEHERLVADGHLEVVVRDPAAERLDDRFGAGPELRERGSEVHARS